MVFEIFKTFIQRLEAANGTDRIKVEDQMNEQGTLILPTRAVYFVDDEGTLHEPVNTDGDFLTKTVTWPDGSVVDITGGFTKVGGGTGSLIIAPVSGDEVIIMYGRITIGAVVTGGGTTISFLDSTLSEMALLADLPLAANNVLHFPTAFADAAVAAGNAIGTPTIYQLMITPGHQLQIAVAMADTEAFSVNMAFRSLLGITPTVTPVGGTFV